MKIVFALVLLFFYSLLTHAQSPELQRARSFASQGKADEAVNAYQNILRSSPASVATIQELAEVYLSMEKYREAYDLAGRGLKINKLHEGLVILRAKAAIFSGKPSEAISLMDALILRKPTNYMAYHVKATALEADNNVHQAIGFYNKSIQLHPKYAENYLRRGGAFYSISRYEQAISDYSKVLESDPTNARVLNYRGLAYAHLENTEEALASFNKAIDLKYWYALVNRAQLFEEQKKYESALTDYKLAVSYLPDFPDSYYGLALTYDKSKKYDDALKSIQKAVALVKDRSHYFAEYAMILISLDRNAEALVQAEKTLETDSRNPNGFIYKAIALSNLQRFDEAVAAITKGISDFPEVYHFYMIRANIYNQQGKRSLANADNQKAKELIKK